MVFDRNFLNYRFLKRLRLSSFTETNVYPTNSWNSGMTVELTEVGEDFVLGVLLAHVDAQGLEAVVMFGMPPSRLPWCTIVPKTTREPLEDFILRMLPSARSQRNRAYWFPGTKHKLVVQAIKAWPIVCIDISDH